MNTIDIPMKKMTTVAQNARKTLTITASTDRIPNPFYNLGRQAGVIVDALDSNFAVIRANVAIDDGLVPVPFDDHIRLYAKT